MSTGWAMFWVALLTSIVVGLIVWGCHSGTFRGFLRRAWPVTVCVVAIALIIQSNIQASEDACASRGGVLTRAGCIDRSAVIEVGQ